MELYLAPMEALTGYIYRNAYHKYFGDADKYFTPFLSSKKLNNKEKNEVIPEHNVGMAVVPQILTNKAEEFCLIAKQLKENYGYEEINLNLGCPSGTVVSKNRGSGFLQVLDELEDFLDYIFTHSPCKISIKTRTGVETSDDFPRIIELYNNYPLKELIVHPRTRVDAYVGKPSWSDFELAVKECKHSLCYNGDINSVEDYRKLMEAFPEIEKVMCGRGLLANPSLFTEIKGGKKCDLETLRQFSDDIFYGYKEIMSGDRNVLFKIKELWIYLSKNFEDADKVLRKIRKSNTCLEYEAAVNTIFKEKLGE